MPDTEKVVASIIHFMINNYRALSISDIFSNVKNTLVRSIVGVES